MRENENVHEVVSDREKKKCL